VCVTQECQEGGVDLGDGCLEGGCPSVGVAGVVRITVVVDVRSNEVLEGGLSTGLEQLEHAVAIGEVCA
jgi:hypothetical protein